MPYATGNVLHCHKPAVIDTVYTDITTCEALIVRKSVLHKATVLWEFVNELQNVIWKHGLVDAPISSNRVMDSLLFRNNHFGARYRSVVS